MGGVAQSSLPENWIIAAVRLFPSRFCRNAYQPISRGTGTSHLRRDPFRSRLLLSAYNAPLLPARTVTRPLCVTHREIKFDRGTLRALRNFIYPLPSFKGDGSCASFSTRKGINEDVSGNFFQRLTGIDR